MKHTNIRFSVLADLTLFQDTYVGSQRLTNAEKQNHLLESDYAVPLRQKSPQLSYGRNISVLSEQTSSCYGEFLQSIEI